VLPLRKAERSCLAADGISAGSKDDVSSATVFFLVFFVFGVTALTASRAFSQPLEKLRFPALPPVPKTGLKFRRSAVARCDRVKALSASLVWLARQRETFAAVLSLVSFFCSSAHPCVYCVHLLFAPMLNMKVSSSDKSFGPPTRWKTPSRQQPLTVGH